MIEVRISLENGCPTNTLVNMIYEISRMSSRSMVYTRTSITNECIKYAAEHAISNFDKFNPSKQIFPYFAQIIKSAMGKRYKNLIKVDRRLLKIKKILEDYS